MISTQQFGFRKNKSTCDAVHELTNFIVANLNKHNKVLTIFLDLTKAFDTVPINTLLVKLEGIGVRGTQLDFFQSYLTGRSQMVKIDDFIGDELPNPCYGVPQGSVLSPTLFLIYINDLCNLKIPNTKIVSFADDTAISFFSHSWSELQSTSQIGLNSAFQWLSTHTLTLNSSKTKFITFSITSASQPKNTLSLKTHTCGTYLHTQCQCPSINAVQTIRYLGLTLDRTLSFKVHINLLTSRVRKLIYIFKTLRHVANPFVLRSVYSALCQSIIQYCLTCWGGTSKTTLKPLEVAHRAILKITTFRPIMYPTTKLYQECGVLNVRQLYILNAILLQHQRTPFTKLKKRRKDKICSLPSTKFTFTKRFFYYLGPSLYNKINSNLPLYGLPSIRCKVALRSFLQTKTYKETEKYLTTVT